MSYLVLARKYRPQQFSELVGQEHVARTLSHAIERNRVHHAFVFTGARGVGKTSAARILAKSLCCVDGPTVHPCGVCEMCQEIAQGRSVDIVEIDGASNTGVDDVRALREGTRYLPSKARLKIYIIDEVHMLSTSAFNALLKTLEEPPAHVVFIFATTEVHKIPPTILSRCQRFDFKLIATARLVAHLEGILRAEALAFEPEALRLVARQAGGSVRDALSLLDQVIAYVGSAPVSPEVVSEVLGIADRRLLMELARAVVGREVGGALRLLATALDRGVDLAQLARAFLGLLRDLEIASRVSDAATLEALVDATADEMAELRALATAPSSGGGARAAQAADLFAVLFDRWARAVDESARVQVPRLIFEMGLVDLCQSEPLEPLGDLLERLQALEARLLARGQQGVVTRARPSGGGPGSLGEAKPPGERAASEGPARRETPLGGARAAEGVRQSAEDPGGDPVAVPAIPVPAIRPPAAEPAREPSAAPLAAAPAVLDAAEVGARSQSTPAEMWGRVRQELERRRPRIGALLASAHVLELDVGKLVLGFADRADVDAAERWRTEIEQALVQEWGRPVGFSSKLESEARRPALIRAESVEEEVRRGADRRRREEEARQHPMVQQAQDLFGVGIREIKT